MNALISATRRLLREPLAQFLLLGAALFLLYRAVTPGAEMAPDRIVVDRAQVARIAQQFERTWMRPPTARELDGLIEGYIDEEILYREALALGLERNDVVIRRRLRQKMDFLNEELGSQGEPTEADLQAYLEAHRDKFTVPPSASFRQVYLKAGDDPKIARERAEELQSKLNAGTLDASQAGDATLLPGQMENASATDITHLFGEAFAAALDKLPPGARWQGPIESGFGLHLVQVRDRDAGGLPPLSAMRAVVEREWSSARRAEAQARFYAGLRKRYSISVEMPEADGANAPGR